MSRAISSALPTYPPHGAGDGRAAGVAGAAHYHMAAQSIEGTAGVYRNNHAAVPSGTITYSTRSRTR